MARSFKVGKHILAWEAATGKRMPPEARVNYRLAYVRRLQLTRLWRARRREKRV